MKKLSLILILSLISLSTFAQREKGYRGFADIGYSLSLSELQYSNGYSDKISDHILVTTTHGYQLLPVLFVGGGIGVNYYIGESEFGGDICLPIFAALRFDKGEGRWSFFAEGKGGYSVGNISGTYFNLQAGTRYALTDRLGLNIGLGYEYQYSTEYTGNASGIAIKVGVDF